MTKKISYAELNQVLKTIDAQMNASEVHGLLTGMLCLSPTMQETVMRAMLVENFDCAQISKKEWSLLKKLASQIVDDFNKSTVIFILLLPDDDSNLAQRVEALGGWCRGYLSGLALAGLTEHDLQNEVVNELVQDLSNIANISIETGSSEEDETNYMELVEYLRIAVQNIQLELRGMSKRIIH